MRTGGNFVHAYIQSRFRLLLLSLFLFAAGVVIGSFCCTTMPQTAEEALYGAFAGEEGLLAVTDCGHVFTSAFLNLLQLWVLMSLCGTSCIGIVFAPALVGVRGFLCGFATAAILILYGMRGLGAAAVGLLPQMLFLLPAMQVLCVGAIRQARAFVQNADRRQRRSQFLSYCVFCLLVLCVFAVVAAYEGYVGWMLILKILS